MYKQKTYKIILLSICLLPSIAFAQTDENLSEQEAKINSQIEKISKIRFNQTLADSLSNKLLNYFFEILQTDESLAYPFDRLKSIGKVESKNKKLRIFTWNIVRNNGTYTYYGLMQKYNKEKKHTDVFILTDSSETLQNPTKITLSEKNWYGALYYELIENKMPDKSLLYTLIGWDGNDLHTTKKIIETLYFTKNGKPKFGKNVFQIKRKKEKRIIFEFSRMANMAVGYKSKINMIVFEHLSPSELKYEGNPSFYGPDYSFDGLEFKYGIWKYIADVPYKQIQKP